MLRKDHEALGPGDKWWLLCRLAGRCLLVFWTVTNSYCIKKIWGAGAAASVEHATLTRVVISRCVGLSPASGCLLTAHGPLGPPALLPMHLLSKVNIKKIHI